MKRNTITRVLSESRMTHDRRITWDEVPQMRNSLRRRYATSNHSKERARVFYLRIKAWHYYIGEIGLLIIGEYVDDNHDYLME